MQRLESPYVNVRKESPYANILFENINRRGIPNFLNKQSMSRQIEGLSYEADQFLIDVYLYFIAETRVQCIIYVHWSKDDETVQKIRILGRTRVARQISEVFEKLKYGKPEENPLRFLNPVDKKFLDGDIHPDEYLEKTREYEKQLEQKLMELAKNSWF